ncbi:MAG: biopolymer transporter ExbD [Myxococcaceae bacterium]
MSASIFRRLELLDTESRRARLKNQRGSGADAAINITPLVDVVLVLLIIFMVVTPMINDGLKLPVAQEPDRIDARTDDLKIILNQAGELKIGDKAVPEAQLGEALTKELSKNPFRTVYLSADKSLQFSKVRTILTALREAGVSQTGLVSTITLEDH